MAKKRQVRRAISLSARASAGDSGVVLAAGEGTLMDRAATGDAAQSSRKGSATGQAVGRPHAMAAAAAMASATPPPMRW